MWVGDDGNLAKRTADRTGRHEAEEMEVFR
jgi:hypothetical protein